MRHTILNVDTNPITRLIRVRLLQHTGFSTLEAGGVDDAFRTAAGARPSLVLIDLHSPSDALRLCRMLRNDARTAHIPLLRILWPEDRPNRSANSADWVNATLIEPAVPSALLNTINNLLASEKSPAGSSEDQRLAHANLSAFMQSILEATFETMVEGIGIVDASGMITRANASARALLEMAGQLDVPFHILALQERVEFTWPDGKALTPDEWPVRRSLKGEVIQNLELHLRFRGTGHSKIVNYSSTPIRNERGAVTHVVVNIHDITEHKNAEEALRKSEESYRQFVQLGTEGMWRWDIVPPMPVTLPEAEQVEWIHCHGAIGECNAAYARQKGYSQPADVVGRSMAATFAGLTDPERRTLDFVRQGYQLHDSEISDTRTGELRYFVASVVGIVKEGKLVSMWGTRRDITETKLAEQALRESQLRFSTLAETVPEILMTADASGSCDYFSKRAYDYTGMPPGSLEAGGWYSLLHPDDSERVHAAIRTAVESSQTFVQEYRVRRADGVYRWFLTRAVPMRDAEGRVEKWFGSSADIDDFKRLGYELEQKNADLQRLNQMLSESNRDLQQFAATVSHDLQSPLNAILLSCRELAAAWAGKAGSEVEEYIGFITASAERMRKLIQNVLAFSKLDNRPPSFDPVDCSEVLARTLGVLSADIKAAGAAVTSDALPTVLGSAGQLEQVFQNLITNAVKYRKRQTPARIHVSAFTENDEWIFSVRDNGIGIDAVNLTRIFKPFERLHQHSEYEGIGIGLAICQRVIERHGGRIWATSEPGQGSTFYFSIPRHAAGAAFSQATPSA
jgi:PAS domain S-box-containing protein